MLVGGGGRLNANPLTGPVFWLPPAHPIPYGTPLSSAQLNATLKNVPGVLTYEPAAGTVLPVGTHLLRVTLTPTDPKVAPYTTEVPLVVNPTDGPQITLQPQVQTVAPGGAGTFVFRMSGAVTGWQWQRSHDLSLTWSDLSDDTNYAGTKTDTLTVSNVNDWFNGSRYRCIASYAGGVVTSNLTMLFVLYPPNVEPVVYSGSYFGTFANGGRWALFAGLTSKFIGYLPSRKSAIIETMSFGSDGSFRFSGTERAAGGPKGELTISGGVTAPSQGVRLVSGQLVEIGETLSGAFPRTGALTNLSGDFFTALALGTAEGELHVIVGYDGSTQAVVTMPGLVDGAAGVLNADGTGTFTTDEGRTLRLALDVVARSVSATLETPAATAGSVGGAVRRRALTVPTKIEFAGVSQSIRANTRFASIATRAHCGVGDAVPIGGFVVTGSSAKRVLIRAVGPSLREQGLGAGEVLRDPIVRVHDARDNNRVVAENDNWGEHASAAEIAETAARLGAQPLAKDDLTSSAMLLSLQPGVYSFVVSGAGSTSGIVLLEVYDADSANAAPRFASIATRAYSSTNNNVAIGGFVLTGNVPKRVLLRAVGPTLARLGLNAADVLPDPTIELHHATRGNVVAAINDNWTDDDAEDRVRTTGARIGATAYGGEDLTSAGLLITLQPGVYSFIARDKNARGGVVLIEVYDAD